MTDTYTTDDPGVLGYKRSSWRNETSLRGVLKRLIAEHPHASKKELQDIFVAKVEEVPSLVEEALIHVFGIHWNSFHDKRSQRSQRTATDDVADDKDDVATQAMTEAVAETTTAPEPPPAPEKPMRPVKTEAEIAATRAAAEAAVAAGVERIKNRVLLDHVMSNGKKLRDCTKAEVREEGAQYIAIADKMSDDATVGQQFNQEQLNSITA